jgi:hypothetical protein
MIFELAGWYGLVWDGVAFGLGTVYEYADDGWDGLGINRLLETVLW